MNNRLQRVTKERVLRNRNAVEWGKNATKKGHWVSKDTKHYNYKPVGILGTGTEVRSFVTV